MTKAQLDHEKLSERIKFLEKELHLKEKKIFELQQILDSIPNLRIFWKDRNLNFMGCNQAFVNDAGQVSVQSMIGRNDYDMPWRDLAPMYRTDDSKVISENKNLLCYEEPQTTPDGQTIWLRTSKVVLHDKDNQTYGVLGIYEDITREKEIELQKKEMEAMVVNNSKLNALGELSGSISHEISNPLSIIQGVCDVIKKLVSKNEISTESFQNLVEKAEHTIERIQSILNGLRNLTRDGSGDDYQKFQIIEPFKEVLNISHQKLILKNIKLIMDENAPAFKKYIFANHVQISQVILNLIHNAYDACNEFSGDRWIKIEAIEVDDQIVIKISNSGNPIDIRTRHRIFEPFFSTKAHNGTGLGLSVSKKIMVTHAGDLVLDDNEAEITFKLSFPIHKG